MTIWAPVITWLIPTCVCFLQPCWQNSIWRHARDLQWKAVIKMCLSFNITFKQVPFSLWLKGKSWDAFASLTSWTIQIPFQRLEYFLFFLIIATADGRNYYGESLRAMCTRLAWLNLWNKLCYWQDQPSYLGARAGLAGDLWANEAAAPWQGVWILSRDISALLLSRRTVWESSLTAWPPWRWRVTPLGSFGNQ